MKAEKIKAFADKVYEKCVDKGMTYDDFGLFAHYIAMREQSVGTDLMRQARRMALHGLEDNGNKIVPDSLVCDKENTAPDEGQRCTMTIDEFRRLFEECLKSHESQGRLEF